MQTEFFSLYAIYLILGTAVAAYLGNEFEIDMYLKYDLLSEKQRSKIVAVVLVAAVGLGFHHGVAAYVLFCLSAMELASISANSDFEQPGYFGRRKFFWPRIRIYVRSAAFVFSVLLVWYGLSAAVDKDSIWTSAGYAAVCIVISMLVSLFWSYLRQCRINRQMHRSSGG